MDIEDMEEAAEVGVVEEKFWKYVLTWTWRGCDARVSSPRFIRTSHPPLSPELLSYQTLTT